MIKLLALAAAGFVLVFLAVFSPLFEIKTVIFNDDDKCVDNSQEITQSQLIGSNLIFFQAQTFAQNIKDQFVCVDTIGLERKFPSTVIIDIKSKEPVALIAETQSQVTKDGLLIDADYKVQIPTVFLPKDFTLDPNKKITDEDVLTALEITDNLLKSDFVPSTVRIIDKQKIAVYSSKDILVIFSSDKDPSSQVDSLQAILAEAKIDATKIDKIDLSFEKPVISYK